MLTRTRLSANEPSRVATWARWAGGRADGVYTLPHASRLKVVSQMAEHIVAMGGTVFVASEVRVGEHGFAAAARSDLRALFAHLLRVIFVIRAGWITRF